MNKRTFKNLIGEKQFWYQTLMLALPIAFQNLLTSSFVLVDTLMVGQLGDVALSSVGMAGQWSWLMNMVVFGICSGASVFVSQYWGAGDVKGIHKITGISVIVGLIVVALFMLPAFFLPGVVVGLFNKNAAVIQSGSTYLKIACFSYPGTVLGTLLGAVLRSVEDVKLPVYSALFTTILNAVLDFLLIFGFWRIPGMGVMGAAVATCISAWAGPIVILTISLAKKNILYAPLKDIFCFNKNLIAQFLKKALPVVANESLWGIAVFLFNMIFANLGHENYAAVTILKTVENIAFTLLIGLGNACCVIMGMSVGSGDIKKAVDGSKRYAVFIPMMTCIVSVILILFRGQVIGLFNLGNKLTQHTIDTAMIISLIYAVEYPIRSISYTFIVGIFRSGGDTVTGAKLDFISTCVVALPITFILAYFVKAPFPVVYAAMYVCDDYLKAFMCIKHYRTYSWLKPVTTEGKINFEKYLQNQHTASKK